MSDTTALADGFDPVDRARWRELVAAAMRRSNGDVAPDDVERLLVTPTDDGYAVHPLYTAEDVASFPAPHDPGRFDYVRGATTADESIDWDVRARHWLDADSPAAIADDLANGVTSLWLTDGDPDHLIAALADVDLEQVPVVVEGFRAGHRLASALLELDRPMNPRSSLGLDPLGLVAATRRSGDIDDAMDLSVEAKAAGIGAFTIDGTVYRSPAIRRADVVRPNWTFSKRVRPGTHDVKLEIFDKDVFSKDDQIDINRLDGRRGLDFRVRTRPCTVLDFAEPYACRGRGVTITRAGRENKSAEIRFTVDARQR